jgi:ribosomal protein S18 acetylase RimI-like enzyme
MLGSSAQVSVRPAKTADAQALAQVFRQSWSHAYAAIIPPLHLETMIARRGVDWWKSSLRSGEAVLVLELNGGVRGYATAGAARTRGRYRGEIYELYVEPIYQGLGLGEQLFESCRQRLDERGLDGLIVWALSDNARAIDFYWRRGGRPVARAFDRFGGRKLEKIAFAWE